MIRKLALLTAAGAFALATSAAAQTPPPGNVNPGSQKSGAEESGAPNQPRSQGGQMGTTGAGSSGTMMDKNERDGINANVKPSSKESGSEPAGEPAPKPR